MVNFFTPRSVCGSSQKPRVSWAYSTRSQVPSIGGVGLDGGHHLGRLEGLRHRLADRVGLHVGGVEIDAFVVVQLAPAGDPLQLHRREGQVDQSLDRLGRQHVAHEPVPVGVLEPFGGLEGVGDGFRRAGRVRKGFGGGQRLVHTGSSPARRTWRVGRLTIT
jgi:hypothetical protein